MFVVVLRAVGWHMQQISYPTPITAVRDFFLQHWFTNMRDKNDRPSKDDQGSWCFGQLEQQHDELRTLFERVKRPLDTIMFDLLFVDAIRQLVALYSFGISSPEEQRDSRVGFGAACYRVLSLLNHSCLPNSSYSCDVTRSGNRMVLRAQSNITVGEEITCTYITVHPDLQVRQQALTQYGFQCSCALCLGSPARSP